jgi:hypothetical protein
MPTVQDILARPSHFGTDFDFFRVNFRNADLRSRFPVAKSV